MNKKDIDAAELRLYAPRIVDGYEQGLTLRSLAKLYGVSHGTIRNILIENGVTLRDKGVKKTSEEKE